jgi:hypothetical protein
MKYVISAMKWLILNDNGINGPIATIILCTSASLLRRISRAG